MNILQVPQSTSLALLRQQISEKLQPWIKTADVVQFVSQKLSVTILSPPEDIFDLETNRQKETVLYNSQQTSTVSYKITGLSEALDLEIGGIERFMADKIRGQQQAVRLTVNVLKNREIVQVFSYKSH